MSGTIASERCLDYVEAQARKMNGGPGGRAEHAPHVVTISREAGSGAHVVADELAELLQLATSGAEVPWKIFDRDLVERVLEEHDLPQRMASFMPEDRMSALSDTLDELFGVHPSSVSLVRKTADTILHLAELGNAIIIGRAGNIVTRHTAGALHVRLVGSVERRIRHVEDHHELGRDAATAYVREHDLGRRRYVETYYDEDIDDPLLYDFVINTDRIGYAAAARAIAEGASARWDAARGGPSGAPRRRPVAI
jgi:cytidylate kinase